jgi:hypothetical protein
MARHSRILLATVFVIACAAETPAAWAGSVTPDSIGSPVLSSPVDEGPVAAGAIITNEYQGSGLLLSVEGLAGPGEVSSATVVRLNNRDLFAAALLDGASGAPPAFLSFRFGGVGASLVLPGTTIPDVADSVTVSLYSNGPILAQLEAFDKNGQLLKTITTQVRGEIDTPVEFDVAGIQSVFTTAFQPVIDPIPGQPPPNNPGYPYAWGVSSIEWHEAPEPAGFVLGGLGMLALLGYAWRRRSMRVRLGVRGA